MNATTTPEMPATAPLPATLEAHLKARSLLPGEATVAELLAQRFGEPDPILRLMAALAVRAPRYGSAGVALQGLRLDAAPLDAEGKAATELAPGLDAAAAAALWQRLLASNLVGAMALRRPLVPQDGGDVQLLLTRRMAREQERVAAALLALAAAPPALAFEATALDAALARCFDDPGSKTAHAAKLAAARQLAVITGGPGTGKTYSVTWTLLLLLHGLRRDGNLLRLCLAAPTGKAAVRMREAIAANLDAGGARLAALEPVLAQHLRQQTPTTLHRLLGMRPDGSVRHHRDNPLAADVVVVDEVSMVDLVMMRKLLEAMPEGARLILLGDRDQLASVDAGTVLADIVAGADAQAAPGGAAPPLSACMVRFDVNRRSADAPAIAAIGAALQRADDAAVDDAVAWLCGERDVPGATAAQVRWLDAPAPGGDRPGAAVAEGPPLLGHDALYDALYAPYRDGLLRALLDARARGAFDADSRAHLLKALDAYRVLATHRNGRRGVAGLLAALEARAVASLSTGQGEHRRGPKRSGDHFFGRPLLITQNDAMLGLVNGDVGLVLPDASGALVAVFSTVGDDPGGGDGPGGGPREVALARLPPHTGAMAMTVHKSQGSEFAHVALVLAEGASQIQTRELVYTGITRARARLSWSGTRAVLDAALRTRVARASGLAPMLRAGVAGL